MYFDDYGYFPIRNFGSVFQALVCLRPCMNDVNNFKKNFWLRIFSKTNIGSVEKTKIETFLERERKIIKNKLQKCARVWKKTCEAKSKEQNQGKMWLFVIVCSGGIKIKLFTSLLFSEGGVTTPSILDLPPEGGGTPSPTVTLNDGSHQKIS